MEECRPGAQTSISAQGWGTQERYKEESEGGEIRRRKRKSRVAGIVPAGQFAQEFLFVETVFEGFAAIDKHDWHLVGELPAQVVIGVNIDLAPMKASPALKFRKLFFHDFTQMASLAGVDDDFSRNRDWLGAHCELRESSKPEMLFPRES